MLVDHLDVGLDVAAARGHPRQAVACGAGRRVGTQPPHAQRQQQATGPEALHRGVGRDGLKAGIQQRGVHAIVAVLGADRAGQADLGQHGAHRAFRDMRGGQSGERRTEPDTPSTEPRPQFIAVHATAMRRQQRGHVQRRRCPGPPRAVPRGPPHRSPCCSVRTMNSATPGASTDATAPTEVCRSSSSISSKRRSRTSDCSPRIRPRGD